MRPVPRDTSVVAFPTAGPVKTEDFPAEQAALYEPALPAGDPGEPDLPPQSAPHSAPAPQGTHCPAGYCPRCWEAGGAQVLEFIAEAVPAPLLACPVCHWGTPARPQPTAMQVPAPAPFQTLLLPNRAPGVDPLAHVAFWAGRPHEVLAIASAETVSCGSLTVPPGVRVFFLRELP